MICFFFEGDIGASLPFLTALERRADWVAEKPKEGRSKVAKVSVVRLRAEGTEGLVR
jgi:hypothetical protein